MPFFATKSPKKIKLTPVQNNVLSGYLLYILLFPGKIFVNIVIWFTVFQQAHLYVAVYRMKKYWSDVGILYLQVVTATFLLACFLSPKESTCKTTKIVCISLQKLFPFSRLSKFKTLDIQFYLFILFDTLFTVR